jgi:hypothetical protein
MATERIHEMPTTNGSYQVQGIVNGVEKQTFYTEKKTKTGKNFRMINFGVEYDNHKSVYMSLNGMPKDKVYFSKKGDDGKNKTIPVDWKDRMNAPEGARMLNSVNCGLTKIVGKDGKEVNNKKVLIDYDACEYIANNLVDGSSVFVRGNIEFGSYRKGEEVARTTKFIPNQISLCKEVDFDDEGRIPTNDFTQTIVFVGIEQEKENDKATGRFVVQAKIVNYNSIESAEFIIEDAKLARLFKSNLKPYWSIEVSGNINVVNVVETVESEDLWGVANKMKRTTAPTRREFVITGADGTTIDKETYTEKKINDAIRKMNAAAIAEENFNGKAATSSDDDWGDAGSMDEEPW